MAAAACSRRTLPRLAQPAYSRTFFNFPSPFGSSASSSPAPERKGTLTNKGGLWMYNESKDMPYSPAQLYSVIADVDSYVHFLPFTTQSRVLSAASYTQDGRRTPQPVAQKGWLNAENGDERWEMDAELRIGAMGFDEGYVSLVEMHKGKWVKATAKDASMFRHLSTLWTFTPSPSSSPSSAPLTKVDLALAYQFTSPLHAAAISTVWDKVSALMVQKFEDRVRAVHGGR
ncbi:hypothetical protein JCM8097_002123 [Rhodosporidiobolus ruineniae]